MQVMGNKSKKQKGFTLVELLVVLALLGVAMAGAFQFFHYTQTSYALADTRSAVLQEIDLFFLQMEKDIRSASAPNSSTKAIAISNEGKEMNVYSSREAPSADNSSVLTKVFTKTSYRLNGIDIQRGFASTENASEVVSLDIDNWQTVVSYIIPGDKQLFNDTRNDEESSRRLIDVNIIVKHPKMPTSISMQTSLLSRTGKSTTSIIESTASNTYVPVQSITITPDPTLTLSNRNAVNTTYKATVVPANATNKNLIWSQNVGSAFKISFTVPLTTIEFTLAEPFVEFVGYSLIYDDGTFEIDDIDTKFDLMFDRFTTR
ncbi:MAG: prepilin-type N-terminal cleavage/methylation domain-containing protein, partial [Syntrophomonadaceae bacterium]|nr:prepilin-type N-terminal cleavage/methylation domain-containing protein [Syntrophomonadaceae bacterium]